MQHKPHSNYSTNNTESQDSNEIDLSYVFQLLWKIRWKISLTFLICFSVACIYFGINYYTQNKNRPLAYTIKLADIVNEHYPNGEKFSISHLVLPQVIKKTLIDLEIEVPNYDNIKNFIELTYYNPNVTLLQEKYSQLANDKKQVQAVQELQSLLNQQQNERQSIRIILKKNPLIPAHEAELFLITLVDNWSDYFIQQGVLSKYTIDLIEGFNMDNVSLPIENIIAFTNYFKNIKVKFKSLLQANKEAVYFTDELALKRLQAELENLDELYIFHLSSLFPDVQNKLNRLLKNILAVQNKKTILKGVMKSLTLTQEIILETSRNPSAANITQQSINALEFDTPITLGRRISLADTYNQLLEQKNQLEEEISALSHNENNITDKTALLLNLQAKPVKPTTFSRYKSAVSSYEPIITKIAKKIQQYVEHFTNVETHKLYSQNHAPHPLSFHFSMVKQLTIILAIAFFLSCLITLILLMKNWKLDD